MRNRDVLAMVTALFGLLGCGGDDPKPDPHSDAKLDSLCSPVCERSVKADCKNGDDAKTCKSECEDAIDDTPTKCEDDLEDYLKCAAKATFSCDGEDDPVAKSCAKDFEAYKACVEGSDAGPIASDAGQDANVDHDTGPRDSGSDAGSDAGPMCRPSTANTCNNCRAMNCCREAVACQDSTNCQAAFDCVDQCLDLATEAAKDACVQTCKQKNSAGFALAVAEANCVTQKCKSECASSSLMDFGFQF